MKECKFKIVVTYDENSNDGSVIIESDTNPTPFHAMVIATEHMMNMTAKCSQKDYQEALHLLVEGAHIARALQTQSMQGPMGNA